jgi:hypothetical protein
MQDRVIMLCMNTYHSDVHLLGHEDLRRPAGNPQSSWMPQTFPGISTQSTLHASRLPERPIGNLALPVSDTFQVLVQVPSGRYSDVLLLRSLNLAPS